jgi:starch phosphorylase
VLHGLAGHAGAARVGYGIRYDFGMFEQRIDGGQQVERHDNWLHLGNAWELPRHEDVQTVRFGGRVEFRRRPAARCAPWVDTRAVIGLPYDSFIVGHRTDTVNTLRLWAARATRDFDLQFFNEGDYRRASRRRSTPRTSRRSSTQRPQREGKELRLKQQYFFVACSIADIVKRYKRRTRASTPSRTRWRSSSTTRTRRSPSRSDARAGRPGGARLGLRRGHHRAPRWATRTTPSMPRPWSAGRCRCSSACCRGTSRSSSDQPPVHAPGAHPLARRHRRMERMSIIGGGAPPRTVRMANLATVGSHSVNGVARCTAIW